MTNPPTPERSPRQLQLAEQLRAKALTNLGRAAEIRVAPAGTPPPTAANNEGWSDVIGWLSSNGYRGAASAAGVEFFGIADESLPAYDVDGPVAPEALIAKALDEYEIAIDRIEGEWGEGASIESLRASGDEDIQILDRAREALDALTHFDPEALRRAISRVVCNNSNFPEGAQVGLLGRDMSPLIAKLVTAVERVGLSPKFYDLEGLANLIVVQFSSENEYTGDEVIGRIRAIVHSQEPHEAGPCIVCDNDPAGVPA